MIPADLRKSLERLPESHANDLTKVALIDAVNFALGDLKLFALDSGRKQALSEVLDALVSSRLPVTPESSQ